MGHQAEYGHHKALERVAELETENEQLRLAITKCIHSFYIGDGKVLAPPELEPHLREFTSLLTKKAPQ